MSESIPTPVETQPQKQPFKPFPRRDGTHLVTCYTNEYEKLFQEKIQKLANLLTWDKNAIEAFDSPKEHFRMRANFQMSHDDYKHRTPEGIYYSMFDPNEKKTPYEVKQFPRATKRINELMLQLQQAFLDHYVIFNHLFEVRFVTTKTNEALIVLLYKKPLADTWLATAKELSTKLNAKIIGRSHKMMQMTHDDEYITEQLTINQRNYMFYQTEGAFSQPNAIVCEKMITWAMKMTENSQEYDLLELYCGGGTFTAPLSTNFKRVLATEISRASVDLAKRCFVANHIDNIKVARLSSEEFTECYVNPTRSFARLTENNINIQDYSIQTVFVDPPRAGLDPGTCQLVSKFDKIVYISCNPETLARDVKALLATHDIVAVAAFDQFPYTDHLESGVTLVKKQIPLAVDSVVTEEKTQVEEEGKEVVEEDSDEQQAKRAKLE